MGYTQAQIKDGLTNMCVNSQRAKLGDLVYGAAAGGYPLDYPGLIYYVNNVSGLSTNDGLSWGTAFAQVSQAISAWNTAQALLTDVDSRGVIYVAGTATAYTGLTALPSYCDIVGVGSNALGNGGSVPRIGSDTAAEDGVLITSGSSTLRGLNFYGIQFQAGTGKSCFTVNFLYKSGFYNCSFMVNGSAASCTTGFLAAKCSGVIFDNCHWGTASNVEPTVGLDISGSHFHHCKLTNCEITGLTAGFRLASGTTSTYRSVMKDCVIASNYGTCALGVDDNATTGQMMFVHNHVSATDAFEMTNNGAARTLENWTYEGSEARIETTPIVTTST